MIPPGCGGAVNIAELERRARRLLTPEVYDYYADGSGSERTLLANAYAWQHPWLMPGCRGRTTRRLPGRRAAAMIVSNRGERQLRPGGARRAPGRTSQPASRGDGTHDSA